MYIITQLHFEVQFRIRSYGELEITISSNGNHHEQGKDISHIHVIWK